MQTDQIGLQKSLADGAGHAFFNRLSIRSGSSAARAAIPVPKTTVHKHNDKMARQHDIGCPRQVATVQPVTVARCEKGGTDRSLGARILATHSSHHSRPDGKLDPVSHRKCSRCLGRFLERRLLWSIPLFWAGISHAAASLGKPRLWRRPVKRVERGEIAPDPSHIIGLRLN